MSEYNNEEDEKNYKTTTASFSICLYCECPYCKDWQNIFDKLDAEDHEYFNERYSVDDCKILVDCERCKKTFIITSTSY